MPLHWKEFFSLESQLHCFQLIYALTALLERLSLHLLVHRMPMTTQYAKQLFSCLHCWPASCRHFCKCSTCERKLLGMQYSYTHVGVEIRIYVQHKFLDTQGRMYATYICTATYRFVQGSLSECQGRCTGVLLLENGLHCIAATRQTGQHYYTIILLAASTFAPFASRVMLIH